MLAVPLIVGGLAAFEYWRAPSSEVAAPLEPEQLVAGYGPTGFGEALAAADAAIAAKRELLAQEPDSWLRMEGLARALLARARLTANPDDMLAANRLLDEALKVAPYPAGPVLSRAGAALVVHDLEGVEAALARLDAGAVEPSPIEQAEARGMRCEVAFERGQFAQAWDLCAPDGSLAIDLRRANMALAAGDPATAAAGVEMALRQPGHTPFQLAALMLQRTAIALAAGDWAAASKWARAADRRFPGYWLAEAFVAQSRALEGDVAGAEAAYRAIGERTGNPDVYGALVVLAEARGDDAAMREYLAKARQSWDAWTALLPDTYGGHFGEHLALSGEIERGLAAAGEDYRHRPYLQPMTDYVFVLGMAGRHDEIVGVVQRGEKLGFRSATLLMAKADALDELERPGEAAKARKAALAINPRVGHPRQAFVHFRLD